MSVYKLHGIDTSFRESTEQVSSRAGSGALRSETALTCPCGWKVVDPGLGVREFHYAHCSEAQ